MLNPPGHASLAELARSTLNVIDHEHAELTSLVALFYSGLQRLGEFELVAPDAVPPDYRRLLDHHSHMTVALESFHGTRLQLNVLAVRESNAFYARKISLARRSDGKTILFGLVRIHPYLVPAPAMEAIRQQSAPLGQLLIEYGVLREVERTQLWRVHPSAELCQVFELPAPAEIFGRTALIYCNGVPAIELLEIIAL